MQDNLPTLVEVRGASMAVTRQGAENGPHLIWAHGWGQSGAAFSEISRSFERLNASFVIDFPGFGRSPAPPEAWGTSEYADAVSDWIRSLQLDRCIWIGHSFGCRIGIRIAARNPELLAGMVLIAAAGIPRRRTLAQRAALRARIYAFKAIKSITPEGPARDRLRERFGSSDYRSAGPMRPVFVKVVSEDLTEAAKTVACPTLLLYGSKDSETPPEIGTRLAQLIRGARLVVLDGYDHYSILTNGQHQVANEIRKFLTELSRCP